MSQYDFDSNQEGDWEEPEKVANSIKIMKIKHAVLTSVDRDDLKDMGTLIWTETIKSIRRLSPNTTLETLIPDFQGIERNIDRIVQANPEVVSHNVETVRRLTREVRIQAKYDRSLEVLRYLKEKGINQYYHHQHPKCGVQNIAHDCLLYIACPLNCFC